MKYSKLNLNNNPEGDIDWRAYTLQVGWASSSNILSEYCSRPLI